MNKQLPLEKQFTYKQNEGCGFSDDCAIDEICRKDINGTFKCGKIIQGKI
jgi:hypothetical protein